MLRWHPSALPLCRLVVGIRVDEIIVVLRHRESQKGAVEGRYARCVADTSVGVGAATACVRCCCTPAAFPRGTDGDDDGGNIKDNPALLAKAFEMQNEALRRQLGEGLREKPHLLRRSRHRRTLLLSRCFVRYPSRANGRSHRSH